MQALDTLSNKLDELLKKTAALEAENKRLTTSVAVGEKKIVALNKKLASLEKDVVSVRLGTAFTGDEERDNMREQLDNVIDEIDKILNTLND